MKRELLSIVMGLMLLAPLSVFADDVPLDCTGNDCGTVSIPNPQHFPTAGQAQPVGTAPGNPIEPNAKVDPVAPHEPPPPVIQK